MKFSSIQLITLTVFVSILSCSSSISQNNDLVEMKLRGKVKQLTQNTYKAVEKFGEIQKGERQLDIYGPENENFVLEFNSSGKILVRNHYSKQGVYVGKTTYDYNDNLITRKVGYDNNGTITDISIIEHDTKENTTKTNINYFSFSDSATYIDYFDKSNKLIKLDWFDKSGKLSSRTIFKYNSNSNLVEQNIYDSEGTLSSKTSNVYNEKSLVTEATSWSIFSRTPLTYYYKYDDFGNVIEESGGKNSDIQTKTIYKYKYDSHNNWTERIRYYSESLPLDLTERIIQYY